MTAESTVGKYVAQNYILFCLLNIITQRKMMNEKGDGGSQHASPSKFMTRLLNDSAFFSCFMARDPLLMDNRP